MNLAPYEEELLAAVADWAFKNTDYGDALNRRPTLDARVSRISRRAVEDIMSTARAAGATAGIRRVLERQLMHGRAAVQDDVRAVVSDVLASYPAPPLRAMLDWARRGLKGPFVPTRGQYGYTSFNEDCLGRALNLSRARVSRGVR